MFGFLFVHWFIEWIGMRYSVKYLTLLNKISIGNFNRIRWYENRLKLAVWMKNTQIFIFLDELLIIYKKCCVCRNFTIRSILSEFNLSNKRTLKSSSSKTLAEMSFWRSHLYQILLTSLPQISFWYLCWKSVHAAEVFYVWKSNKVS